MKDVVKTNIKRPNSTKRTRRRKRNMSLYYFIIAVLVIGVGISLSMTFLFNVRDIEITGQTGYTEEEVIRSSKIYVGENLIRLDKQQVTGNVLGSLVYIENIKVSKKFPDTLKLELTKSVAGSNVQYDGGYLTVSEGGKILENTTEPYGSLVTVKGLSPSVTEPGKMLECDDDSKLKIYKDICSEIKKNNVQGMVDIDLTDQYDILLNYQNRITIKVGNSTNLEYKITYANTILTNKIAADKSGYLIFSGSNQFSYVTNEDMQAYLNGIGKTTETTLPQNTASDTESTGSDTIAD